MKKIKIEHSCYNQIEYDPSTTLAFTSYVMPLNLVKKSSENERHLGKAEVE